MRAGLLEDAPETYYGTDHYVDYPVVLVRMSRSGPNSCGICSVILQCAAKAERD